MGLALERNISEEINVEKKSKLISFDHEKYYPGETVNIRIKSLINIIQENNWVIVTKNG